MGGGGGAPRGCSRGCSPPLRLPASLGGASPGLCLHRHPPPPACLSPHVTPLRGRAAGAPPLQADLLPTPVTSESGRAPLSMPGTGGCDVNVSFRETRSRPWLGGTAPAPGSLPSLLPGSCPCAPASHQGLLGPSPRGWPPPHESPASLGPRPFARPPLPTAMPRRLCLRCPRAQWPLQAPSRLSQPSAPLSGLLRAPPRPS